MGDVEGNVVADPWEAEAGGRGRASYMSSDGLPVHSSSLLPSV